MAQNCYLYPLMNRLPEVSKIALNHELNLALLLMTVVNRIIDLEVSPKVCSWIESDEL